MSCLAHGESISFDLYELHGGERTLLARGTRQYSQRDVRVEEGRGSSWKEIPVADGFSAGISIFPEPEITGFGLWLKDRGSFWGEISSGGFSWDWFQLQAGDVYWKLQGGGRVRVTFVTKGKNKEVASVEALEDFTLRTRVRPWFLSVFSDQDTHNMVVKKGSVIRVAW